MRLRLAAAVLSWAGLTAGLAAQEPRELPRLGIGPGRELLLLGDGEPAIERAMRWAERLDTIESAYRRSSLGLAEDERRGTLEVGHIGRCRIRSVPVDGDSLDWSSRRTEQGVEIQRHLRWVEGDGDCGGHGLDLYLLPAPRGDVFAPPYVVEWTDLELPVLGFLDLEPTPRVPAVRALARSPATARETVNVAAWPAAGARGVDLCQAPFMDTLCLKDLRIREQLATAAATHPDPSVAGPIIDGCRAFFDRLPSVPSPHPCTDPGAWRQVVGVYRVGYLGDMALGDRAGLSSRVGEAGDVQWLVSDASRPSRKALGELADGTRVELSLPDAAPPRVAERPAAVAPRPDGWRPDRPAPGARRSDRPAQTMADRPATATPPPAVNETSRARPVRAAVDPPPRPPITQRPATRRPPSQPRGERPAAQPPPVRQRHAPAVVDAPGSPAVVAAETGPPSGSANGTAPPAPAAADDPVEPTAASMVPPKLNLSAYPEAVTPGLLWPIVLTALATTVLIALLLRVQRASVRSRRRFLPVVSDDETDPGLLLEPDVDRDPSPEETIDTAPIPSPEETIDTAPVPSPDETIDTAPIPSPEGTTDTAPNRSPEGATDTAPIRSPEGATASSLGRKPQEGSTPPIPSPVGATDEGPDASEPREPSTVLPLEPPELSEPPEAPPDSRCLRLAREVDALPGGEREGIDRSLSTITRLGDWVSCLLPVLDQIKLDRLPAPAQREWREACRTLREFTDVDAVAFHRLRRQLTAPSNGAPAPDDGGAEAEYLEAAGLLDPERGNLVDRLRRHLLRPAAGRLQALALALQYLIEAFPVEHLDREERKAYLGAVRQRLQARGLSTKFHRLIEDLAAGLGLSYRQAKYYKTPIDEGDDYDAIDLTERVGYPAGAEDRIVVRLAELFLSDGGSDEHYSGLALVDDGSDEAGRGRRVQRVVDPSEGDAASK